MGEGDHANRDGSIYFKPLCYILNITKLTVRHITNHLIVRCVKAATARDV